MRIKKIGITALALVLGLSIATPQPSVSASSAQKQSVYTAQAHFMKANKIMSGKLLQTLKCDVTNDGKEEIILSGQTGEWPNSQFFVGIYDAAGKLLINKRLESSSFAFLQIRKLHTGAYKNVLAFEQSGGGAGQTVVEVWAWQKNALKSLLTTDASNTNITYKDTDGDGNEEIIGYSAYFAPETENVGYRWKPLDKFLYKWDDSKKKYISFTYGQDGKRDDLRKPVGAITAAQGVQIINKAASALKSGEKRMTAESFTKRMQFLVTYNLIYRVQSGASGTIDRDNVSLFAWAAPASAQTSIAFSPDKNKATLKQKMRVQEFHSDEWVNYESTAVLYKTKYGWKVDQMY